LQNSDLILNVAIVQDIVAKKKDALVAMYPDYEKFGQDTSLYEKDATTTELRYQDNCLDIQELSASSLRILVKAEEELSQARHFSRIFPSSSRRYKHE